MSEFQKSLYIFSIKRKGLPPDAIILEMKKLGLNDEQIKNLNSYYPDLDIFNKLKRYYFLIDHLLILAFFLYATLILYYCTFFGCIWYLLFPCINIVGVILNRSTGSFFSSKYSIFTCIVPVASLFSGIQGIPSEFQDGLLISFLICAAANIYFMNSIKIDDKN